MAFDGIDEVLANTVEGIISKNWKEVEYVALDHGMTKNDPEDPLYISVTSNVTPRHEECYFIRDGVIEEHIVDGDGDPNGQRIVDLLIAHGFKYFSLYFREF